MPQEPDREKLYKEILKAISFFGQRQAQLNLQSSAAKELLAEEIAIGLYGKFYFTSYTNEHSSK